MNTIKETRTAHTGIPISLKLKQTFAKLVRDKYLYLILVPFLSYYIVFHYLPMFGLQIAFKDYNIIKGIGDSPWVGLYNFTRFFNEPYFWRTLRNTLVIGFYRIAFGFPIPIILALLFNEVKNKSFKRISQTLVYIPHFISAVVVAGLVTNFLAPENGLINLIIERLGGEKIYFLMKAEYFRTIYITMEIWKESGYMSIIFISALAGIDMHLYEAASVDGAGRLRQLWHVTIPGILPTIVMMLILKIGHILDVGFESILLLYQPVTYETADIIGTYVYRSGLLEAQYSLSAAVGLFNGVVGLVIVCLANKLSQKVTEVGLW